MFNSGVLGTPKFAVNIYSPPISIYIRHQNSQKIPRLEENFLNVCKQGEKTHNARHGNIIQKSSQDVKVFYSGFEGVVGTRTAGIAQRFWLRQAGKPGVINFSKGKTILVKLL